MQNLNVVPRKPQTPNKVPQRLCYIRQSKAGAQPFISADKKQTVHAGN